MNSINTASKKIIFPVCLIAICGLFYWFQWRPSQIKHGCSWVKMHTDAIQAKTGMTEEELREKGLLRTCPAPTSTVAFSTDLLKSLSDPNNPIACASRNKEVINANKSQEYVSAKDWYRATTTAEYQFCLHDNGL